MKRNAFALLVVGICVAHWSEPAVAQFGPGGSFFPGGVSPFSSSDASLAVDSTTRTQTTSTGYLITVETAWGTTARIRLDHIPYFSWTPVVSPETATVLRRFFENFGGRVRLDVYGLRKYWWSDDYYAQPSTEVWMYNTNPCRPSSDPGHVGGGLVEGVVWADPAVPLWAELWVWRDDGRVTRLDLIRDDVLPLYGLDAADVRYFFETVFDGVPYIEDSQAKKQSDGSYIVHHGTNPTRRGRTCP